jgi:hypothetical protein
MQSRQLNNRREDRMFDHTLDIIHKMKDKDEDNKRHSQHLCPIVIPECCHPRKSQSFTQLKSDKFGRMSMMFIQ